MSLFELKSTAWVMTVLALTGFGVAGAEESAASPVDIAGIVFEDLDGDGAHDEGEPGIADVRVSDQVAVVHTGLDGTFSLQSVGGYGLVYVSQPDGYSASGSFWRRVAAGSDASDLQFPLVKTGEPTDFTSAALRHQRDQFGITGEVDRDLAGPLDLQRY